MKTLTSTSAPLVRRVKLTLKEFYIVETLNPIIKSHKVNWCAKLDFFDTLQCSRVACSNNTHTIKIEVTNACSCFRSGLTQISKVSDLANDLAHSAHRASSQSGTLKVYAINL